MAVSITYGYQDWSVFGTHSGKGCLLTPQRSLDSSMFYLCALLAGISWVVERPCLRAKDAFHRMKVLIMDRSLPAAARPRSARFVFTPLSSFCVKRSRN
jgi:hypothetical protein